MQLPQYSFAMLKLFNALHALCYFQSKLMRGGSSSLSGFCPGAVTIGAVLELPYAPFCHVKDTTFSRTPMLDMQSTGAIKRSAQDMPCTLQTDDCQAHCLVRR